jgi:hypothetical protein
MMPPGGNGMTSLIGLVGYFSCASALESTPTLATTSMSPNTADCRKFTVRCS